MSLSCAACKITVRGSSNINWVDYVGDMLIDVQVSDGTVQTTTLFSHPIDLEAFLGLLHLLVDRGFPVVAFEYSGAEYARELQEQTLWAVESVCP